MPRPKTSLEKKDSGALVQDFGAVSAGLIRCIREDLARGSTGYTGRREGEHGFSKPLPGIVLPTDRVEGRY